MSNDGYSPGRTSASAAAVDVDVPLPDIRKTFGPPVPKVREHRGSGCVQSTCWPDMTNHIRNGRGHEALDLSALGLERDVGHWEKLIKMEDDGG